jgi:predicted kinase
VRGFPLPVFPKEALGMATKTAKKKVTKMAKKKAAKKKTTAVGTPLESLGQILKVEAKNVNKQTVIELHTRMPFRAATFQKLGNMMNGSVTLTFDPSQLDAFPEARNDPEGD